MVGASRELGKYRLVNEVAKSQLGALWAGLGGDSKEGEEAPLVLVRRFDTSVIANADQIDTLSEAAWWAMELSTDEIAQTLDVVKTEDELGMVYAYNEGEVFRALVRLATFKRKPFPVPVALRIMLDVLEAVATVRAQAAEDHIEIACGGLSPDSVFVATDGVTRLLDVGAAGVMCAAERVLKNPEMAAYAAPEQLVEEAVEADARADVFTAGVLMSEMLLGKRLFVGSNYAAVSAKVKEAKVPRLDAAKPAGGEPIPTEVADLVARALSADAAERFADCRELMAALEALSIEPAEREAVGGMVEALDGNALATRRKVIDRARSARPAAKSFASLPKPAVTAPKAPVTAPKPPTKSAPGHKPPPPPPRAPMESLDSELLQPDSEAPESAGVPVDVELDAPKVPVDIPPPPGFVDETKAEEGEAADKEARTSKPGEVSEGALIEALTTDTTPKPESAADGDSDKKESAEAKPAEDDEKKSGEEEEEEKEAAEASSPEASSAPDAAASATTLDATSEDSGPRSLAEVDERTQRMRRMVAMGIGGLAVLLVGGWAISAMSGHGKTAASASAAAPPPPAASASATAAAATASEAPPPSAAASAPSEGEADAGTEEAQDAAPEAAAEESAPEEVASATKPKKAAAPATQPHPHPVIHHHYKPHPKPKPKHKFTPSGI